MKKQTYTVPVTWGTGFITIPAKSYLDAINKISANMDKYQKAIK